MKYCLVYRFRKSVKRSWNVERFCDFSLYTQNFQLFFWICTFFVTPVPTAGTTNPHHNSMIYTIKSFPVRAFWVIFHTGVFVVKVVYYLSGYYSSLYSKACIIKVYCYAYCDSLEMITLTDFLGLWLEDLWTRRRCSLASLSTRMKMTS